MKFFSKISGWGQATFKFLKEVKSEIGKVSWPTREETIKHTLIVIGVSLAVAIFLGGLDLLFVFLLNKFILFR